jgi:hypothetical protein
MANDLNEPQAPMVTAIDDLLRVDLNWWDERRLIHDVNAEDLKYMNSIVVSKLICPRVIYIHNTDRAMEILTRLNSNIGQEASR